MRKAGEAQSVQFSPEEIRRRRIEQARSIKGDGFLFSGNRQQCVPADLLLDRRLTPLERNAWQVFRLLLSEDGLTAFPTYEELRQYLSTTPGALASPETVSRVLTILRLTRWLSLVRRRRDPQSGRPLGNVYVLHDTPLTPYEAMELDPNYLELLGQSLTSKTKAVGTIVQIVLEEIGQDPALKAKGLPTRLEILKKRLAESDAEESYPQAGKTVDPQNRLRLDTTDSVVPAKPAQDVGGEGLQQSSTVRSISNIKIRTTAPNPSAVVASPEVALPTAAAMVLRLPQSFRKLREEQQQGALAALGALTMELQQTVLDEWSERCRTDAIRAPANYLFGMIQKAMRGQFNATRCKPAAAPRPVPPSPPPPPPAPLAKREHVYAHLASLRKLLHMPEPT